MMNIIWKNHLKFSLIGILIVISIFHQSKAQDERISLHGMLRGVHDDPPDVNLTIFKCTFSAFSDESKCDAAVSEDGTPCSYCTLEKNGQEAGLCVSSEEAQQMEQVNPDIKCSGIGALEFPEEGVVDTTSRVDDIQNTRLEIEPKDFQCTAQGFGNIDKCMNTKASDDEWCVYCNFPSISEDKGLCMSYSQSRSLDKSYGSLVSCADHEVEITYDNIVENKSNPVVDCNLKGKDEQTCLDSSRVNGSDCTWCDAEIGGFCFPKKWKQTAAKFLKCTDSEDTIPNQVIADQEKSAKNIFSTFNTSCVKNRDDVSCSMDDDSESGQSCVWCDAAGIFGLCLDPEGAHKVESYLNCGNSDSNAKEMLVAKK
eukprot:CAMPEP_0184866584 /NCGR_PEP_ID=MMETSP0580-20130426/22820_1 /TAXON_ID=1118495 /ORGANISM="Dactyliosolen fragilissimus" /LENGTH=368 /DNA_ID=CAMNT_0027366325 /DNA_START=18 /DNA_END=1124 /DNA_ORIENTATION=+